MPLLSKLLATLLLIASQWAYAQGISVEASALVASTRTASTPLVAVATLTRAHAAATSDADKNYLAQMLAFALAQAGEYDAAERVFPFGPGAVKPTELPREVQLEPALAAIVTAARERQLVMINEAHHVPATRALTIALLPELRALGFTHLAVEALDHDAGLSARGYAVRETGFYMREPVFGELIRTALALGFKLIAYEQRGAKGPEARESLQAKSLYEQTFARDPKLKVLVHAGYAHVFERRGALFNVDPLALKIRALSGIDPLTIDQTLLRADPLQREHPRYREWAAQCSAPACALLTNGQPLQLPHSTTDWSVLLPPSAASWRTLHGLRREIAIPALCAAQLPCLIEARFAKERADAVAMDRCVVRQLGDCRALYLRAGDWVLTASAIDGTPLARQRLRLSSSSPSH